MMNTDFDKTEEILLQTIREQAKEEIVPGISIKNSLDKAWTAKNHKFSVFTTQIPFYQATAAAVVFLLIGFGISFLRPVPIETIYKTIETVQYIDRPVKQIEYVKVPVIKYITKQKDSLVSADNPIENVIASQETNLESMRQNEIAMHNLNHILNEEQGISIADDTLIQKMLITIY